MATFREQFKSNFIAILSLTIVIISFGFNSWRAEVSEKNQNMRTAGFEILKNLGQLQIVVNYAYYEPDNMLGSPYLGWGYVSLASDLSNLMTPSVAASIHKLVGVWGANFEGLKKDGKAADLISAEIDTARQTVLNSIRSFK